jgi:hypothetical protein
VNLTLICQGHEVGGRHFDSHLMVAGEWASVGAVSTADERIVQPDTHAGIGTAAAEAHQETALSLASVPQGTPTLAIVPTGAIVTSQGEFGLSTLTISLLAALALAFSLQRTRLGSPSRLLRTQAVFGPDPPPPRPALSV